MVPVLHFTLHNIAERTGSTHEGFTLVFQRTDFLDIEAYEMMILYENSLN